VLLRLWKIPGLTKLNTKAAKDWNTNTKEPKQNRQREPLEKTGLKEQVTNSREHTTNIGDTPEAPGSSEQGTLHCRTSFSQSHNFQKQET